MTDLSPRDWRFAKLGIVDPRTGELTSYGEYVAKEFRYGRQESDGGNDFSEMGPDLGPHDR